MTMQPTKPSTPSRGISEPSNKPTLNHKRLSSRTSSSATSRLPPPIPDSSRRTKLRHASSAPPKSLITTSALKQSHQCPQCHFQQTKFYCESCLSNRVVAHHKELSRLSEARASAKRVASGLLGIHDAGQSTAIQEVLPDPFDNVSQDMTTPNLKLRCTVYLRARRAELSSRLDQLQACIAESRSEQAMAREKVQEKRNDLRKRRENLSQVWQGLGSKTSPPSPERPKNRWSPQRSPGAWPGDNPHVFGGQNWSTDVYQRWDHDEQHRKAQHATRTDSDKFSIGDLVDAVRTDITKLEKRIRQISQELERTRAILAKEAFDIFAIRPPPGEGSKSSSSLKKGVRSAGLGERFMPGAFAFGREAEHPSSNAESVADWSIAGLVLPLPSDIRRFPRDSINGAITHTVHLLQLLTNYLGITLPFAIGAQGGKINIRPHSLWDGGGGSSKQALHLSGAAYAVLSALTVPRQSLGESTLSTLESFIQLPPRSHLSWGLASVLPTDDPDPKPARKSDPGAKAFISALVMLSYNIAYLSSTQGVKTNLISAAGNSLRLLHRAIHHPDLGKLSHSNYAGIKDLSFHGLDYHQLVQILEPNNRKEEAKGRRIMEQSYVDAAPKQSTSLDFLRKRGLKLATKPGAVIFNGVEIGGTKKKQTEEEWDFL